MDMMEEDDIVRKPNLIKRLFSWRPTSEAHLKLAEDQILNKLNIPYKTYFINISNNNRIRVIKCPPRDGESCNATPLLMLHGFASGIGLWILNLESLSARRTVYAIDLPGFGRSSRGKFPSSAESIEDTFVTNIDECVQKLSLDKFILLGHSFGAFLAAAYSLKYADKLQALILCDAWGFPERPPDNDELSLAPGWRAVASCLVPFNPLASVRAFGPWGPGLIERFRQDIQLRFASVVDSKSLFRYIYHCNAQKPSGESAFRKLSIPIAWAKNPMIKRVADIDKNLPLYMIYGSRTWIDKSIGFTVQEFRKDCEVHLEIIQDAGHHVYSDMPEKFNNLIDNICSNYIINVDDTSAE